MLTQLPNEGKVVSFWPGEFLAGEDDRCAVAITKGTGSAGYIHQIKAGAILKSQQIQVDVSTMIYDSELKLAWIGIVYKNTLSWVKNSMLCSDIFRPDGDVQSTSYPNTQFDVGFASKNADSPDYVAVLIGSNIVLRFSINSLGLPKKIDELPFTSKLNATSRTVVGFGDALGVDADGTVALARRLVVNNTVVGELLLLSHSRPPASRYIDRLSALTAHRINSTTVVGLALVDPLPNSTVGYVLGFVPGHPEPASVAFDLGTGNRWSESASITESTDSSVYGSFLVGSSKPGTLEFHFAELKSGHFGLSNYVVHLSMYNLFLGDDLVFVSAPNAIGSHNNNIYAIARSDKGPVVVEFPFPDLSGNKRKPKISLQSSSSSSVKIVASSLSTSRSLTLGWKPSAVLCNQSLPCDMLDPSGSCSSDTCCQMYQFQDSTKFASLCCKDCTVGVCLNSQCE